MKNTFSWEDGKKYNATQNLSLSKLKEGCTPITYLGMTYVNYKQVDLDCARHCFICPNVQGDYVYFWDHLVNTDNPFDNSMTIVEANS